MQSLGVDCTRAAQALLQAGHAQQANNVAQAYLEDHTDSVEARVLAAMASLQSAPTSLATDTVSALEGVQQARQVAAAYPAHMPDWRTPFQFSSLRVYGSFSQH